MIDGETVKHSLVTNIRQWLKYRRIVRKIMSRLPVCHPETGQRIRWNISVCRECLQYDEFTGECVLRGPIRVLISQQQPACLIDSRVYRFNWNERKIERVPGGRWAM